MWRGERRLCNNKSLRRDDVALSNDCLSLVYVLLFLRKRLKISIWYATKVLANQEALPFASTKMLEAVSLLWII